MTETYPVAIIGGGPVDLVSSILLSQQRILHVVFERHPLTSIHPKACGMNMRTIEVFRQLGIEDQVPEQRAPPEIVSRTAWYTNLGLNGLEIIGRDVWGGGKYVVIAQIRLEPILLQHAKKLNSHGIHHGVEVTDVEEDGDHVSLTICAKGKSEARKVKARYVVGADGGRALTDNLGIKWEGEKDIVELVSAHFKARISLHHPDPRVFITWFIDPKQGGSIKTGYLYHLGPYPSIPDRGVIPNLEVEIKSIDHWRVYSIVAERYRSPKGCIFVIGDSAHRIPPWGALGLNSGIQDAYNAIWKLGIAVRGEDAPRWDGLLDTYETERHPIALRVARTSLHNLRSHSSVMDRALGFTPQHDNETNVRALQSFFNPLDADYYARRRAVYMALETLDSEFHALGAETGWFYPDIDRESQRSSPDHGGQLLPNDELDCIEYYASILPGHNLPHAWLERDGVTLSTRDLLLPDRFLWLTSEPYYGPHVVKIIERACPALIP
ncbi:hypothetical protein BO82DRAFT_375776 [Aspergillus uvarum CBS 121591]|uniref:FAD-binding domain-containing protein n=1 Tax=Aspergillus uvarum CBS 121591 TaxID=1448315 RepID=A0A319C2X3_9EURO|nr:hypothetical protein BO82DRAFT_375776 [Aspergillus uvarum CBS 121591]PYH80326.1 hypothetical protein BO82DRAFT_375776 [Aspergillus uvarum CBS 121591]